MSSIAVFGTSGTLGKYVLESLSSDLVGDKIAYPIKAITTKDKSAESSDKVEYVQGDLIADADAIAEKLKGVDVIISLVKVEEDIIKGLEKVILAVKPKIYIPSEYGIYHQYVEGFAHPVLDVKAAHSETIRKAGIKTVEVITAFFRIPPVFLYAFTNHAGVDQQSKTVTYTDNKVIQFSTGKDIGNTISVIATTEPSKAEDVYFISSGSITVPELVAKLEKEQDTTYKVVEKSADDIIKGYEASGNDFVAFLFAAFAQGKSSTFKTTGNELVNPGESLWKWDSF